MNVAAWQSCARNFKKSRWKTIFFERERERVRGKMRKEVHPSTPPFPIFVSQTGTLSNQINGGFKPNEYSLNLPVVIWVKFHDPFNAILVSKHSCVCTPRTVTNRPFNTATC